MSSVVTEYLLDMQPGLWKVIAADDGTNVNRYLHDITGIAQHENPSGDWNWPALDGLGTVRQVYDDTLSEVYAADRDPYGVMISATGSNPTPYEYTGEMRDANDLQYHRARYLDTSLGVWLSEDPLETANRYAYAAANPINLADPSGNFACSTIGSGGFNTAQLIASAIPPHTLNAVLADGVPRVGGSGNQEGGITAPPYDFARFLTADEHARILDSVVVIVAGKYTATAVCARTEDILPYRYCGNDSALPDNHNVGEATLVEGDLVVSHDHYAGIPSDAQAAIDNWKTTGIDWIEFRGRDNSGVHIPIDKLEAHYSETPTAVFRYPSSSGATIGIPAKPAPFRSWGLLNAIDIKQTYENATLYFTYIIGDNNRFIYPDMFGVGISQISDEPVRRGTLSYDSRFVLSTVRPGDEGLDNKDSGNGTFMLLDNQLYYVGPINLGTFAPPVYWGEQHVLFTPFIN